MKKFSEDYKYGFHDQVTPGFKVKKGLSEAVVRQKSEQKQEPSWMLDYRLRALEIFWAKPLPRWGANLSGIDFDNLIYYSRPQGQQEKKWSEVPAKIKKTFDRLGLPQAERKWLAGVKGQYDSEVVYGSLKKELQQKNIGQRPTFERSGCQATIAHAATRRCGSADEREGRQNCRSRSSNEAKRTNQPIYLISNKGWNFCNKRTKELLYPSSTIYATIKP